ncbi:MAG: tetratricopeptide repeat protein [FCB group bacterium]|jgi:tetratricopeptide (TPR) repeat protein
MRKDIIELLIIALLFLSQTTFANEAADNFQKANDFFKKGNYTHAVELYRSILNNGYESGDVYYNMGNCYYRMNKIPEAILYYERAKRLAPDDEDINFNLNIANLRIVDKIEPIPQFFLFQWFENFRSTYTSGTWATLTVLGLWLGFICLAGFILFWNPGIRKLFFTIAIASFIFSTLFYVFATQTSTIEETRNEAVIFKPSVYVKSSPDESGKDLFILHEGTKVKVLDEAGDWRKIKLANGSLGWTLEQNIEVI